MRILLNAYAVASRAKHSRIPSSDEGLTLEHFQAKWTPVRVKKIRENKNLEPRFDSIKSGNALGMRPRRKTRAG
jgi:hypothetical protein